MIPHFGLRRRALLAAALLSLSVAAPLPGGAAIGGSSSTLRVCADPDYMPYSARNGGGFENKIALAVGRALGEPVTFAWAPMRGPGGFDGFLRETLRAGKCDVLMDVPYASDNLKVTRPYYISSYVFVFPKAKHYDITSMDSPALKNLRIGFEADTPAEMGLKLRALILHADPYEIGDEEGVSPAKILDGVQSGKIAVAVTWEPSIGYFLRQRPDLAVVPVPNSRSQGSPEQYVFPMSMATRPDDGALAAKLERVISQHKAELDAILSAYGVRLYQPPAS
ncbi:MAG TPA: transporter substrate-binding domain-containing protein [Candidatus Limnocylindria bacterium]|jgi:mxaJ protein|nr:transporter substrate-binding domain-containing protein [Candidatus Limnocylindria bacterium]